MKVKMFSLTCELRCRFWVHDQFKYIQRTDVYKLLFHFDLSFMKIIIKKKNVLYSKYLEICTYVLVYLFYIIMLY